MFYYTGVCLKNYVARPIHCPLAFALQYLCQNFAQDVQIKNRFFIRFLWNFSNLFLSRHQSTVVGPIDFLKKGSKNPLNLFCDELVVVNYRWLWFFSFLGIPKSAHKDKLIGNAMTFFAKDMPTTFHIFIGPEWVFTLFLKIW